MKKQELCGTKWIAEMEEGKALRQPLRRGRGGCDNNCKARRTIEHYICSVRTKTKWYSYEKTDLLTKSMNSEDSRSYLQPTQRKVSISFFHKRSMEVLRAGCEHRFLNVADWILGATRNAEDLGVNAAPRRRRAALREGRKGPRKILL